MKKNRKSIELFNLSFLDVVSCGFGAIILLLVLIKVSEPMVLKETNKELQTEQQTVKIEIAQLKDQLKTIQEQIIRQDKHVSSIQQAFSKAHNNFQQRNKRLDSQKAELEAQKKIAQNYNIVQQNLTEEMVRLQQTEQPVISNSIIGGIPVDSEYVIFIIDTSGSMQQHAWPLVRKKMAEILNIYPKLLGLQVMNDMGDYMFSQYSGKWIRDSEARRKAILKRLSSWQPFSNSSPEEGINAAIKRFYTPGKKISLYIFGDDFSRGNISDVVDSVLAINKQDSMGGMVRIHTVGFPVLFDHPQAINNISRFSALMRILAEENNGSFVGLNSL